ncbi:MAG: 1-acyl-sn-glycerol-3-phosphate acyltransferase [Thermoleophilia bacterium]|nr:1-acyl-sn-glycerol-3-phosphate acyltransferase [Thermoleophilia bacterium]
MYSFFRLLSWGLLRVLFRVRVSGRDYIPPSGPLVVVANHESFLDPFVVGTVLMNRQATFLAAPWLYARPLVGWFVRGVGAIPAYGEGAEVTALRESIRTLQRGGTVALFPQGGIARDGISGGAAFMAIKAPAPLLPMRISGAGRALPLKRWWPSLFTRIRVDIRAPVMPSEIRAPECSTSAAVEKGRDLLARVLME